MSAANWLSLALLITGFATQLATIHNWQEATSPGFVAGFLLAFSGAITAFFSHKPGVEDESTIARKD